jgi:hypothetical protein
MGKGSKISYWAGAFFALVLVVLLSLAVIVPRVVDSAWLKETIQAEVTKQINGDFDFHKAKLSILPAPVVSLQQVSLNIPETVQVNLDSIKVYPKLLPLITGNIELNEVVINKPDLSLLLPEKSEKKTSQEKTFSLSETLKTVSSKLSPILSASGLEVNVHEGILRLLEGNKEVFLFESINGRLNASSKSLTISLSSSANIWESMQLNAKLTPDSQEGKGEIVLENMDNRVLAEYFRAEHSPLIEGLISSLQVNFTISPETGISAEIQSSGSTITVSHEAKKITAEIDRLEGNALYSNEISSITVDDLTLSYPQIHLNGTFNFDRTAPKTSLDIKAKNSDIKEVRELLPVFITALFGELPVVQEIFKITRGGTITEADFHVEGKSLADLAVFESMLIKGHVKDADISLADLGLDLQEVTGDVTIVDGVLEGKNLQAKLGNTIGSGGTFKLGLLKKEITPFHLDLNLNADISEVPPLLKQLLPDENLHEYLSLFENVKGTSQGKLTLGESLESLNARVEADKINAQAKLKPIPYPIAIDGGRIIYDGLKTESLNLQGKVGKSTFSNYSSRINFEGEPTIEVESGIINLVMDEIFPWLTKNKKLAEELQNIKSITGLAEVNVKSIKGPMLQPANLQYEVQGSLKNIALTAITLPGTLNIKSGSVNIMPDNISFEDIQADLLDSSLTYSGVIQNFISGTTKAEIIVTNAEIGTQVNDWFVEEIKAPKEYQFRTPLLISRAAAKWTREELLDLQGDFSIKNGPIFSVDLMLNPDEFNLRNLFIQNGADRARIALDLEKRKIAAEFQGSLAKKTLDQILIYEDADHHAWIKGDIKFNIDMDSFAASTASGKLEGGDFIIPLEFNEPLLLDGFSLSATDKSLTLNSTEALFQNKKYALSGQASLDHERLSMDFDIRTDTIDLDKIVEVLQGEEEKEKEEGKEEQRVGKEWDLSFDTTINIFADSLLYNGYTWEPFESQITLANSFFSIEIVKAELCNISTPGKVSFHEGKISLDIRMDATDEEFSEVLICLEGGEQQMTGTLNLQANISAYGTKGTLVNSLQGNLLFSAKEGYIYQDARAAKLLYFLNVTNMFQGKIPDLSTTGFHYDYLIVKGTMENGILKIAPAKLEAPIMEIASNGTIDIPKEKIYLQVLVAPLQTLNKIQKLLPIISKVIPGSLVAVPVEVSGDFSDIKVRALSMSAISIRALGIMVGALSAPVRVLEDTSEEAK